MNRRWSLWLTSSSISRAVKTKSSEIYPALVCLLSCHVHHQISQSITDTTALKTITAELPPDGKIAVTTCAKLTPKLLTQISNVCSSLYPFHKSLAFIQSSNSTIPLPSPSSRPFLSCLSSSLDFPQICPTRPSNHSL